MKDNESQTHESYGMIECCRVTGTNESMFGSSIKHSNQIRIRIKEASIERDLNADHFSSGNTPIIEVALSPIQFAEWITTPNTMGVPCTIKYIGRNKIESPPDPDKLGEFRKEFKDDLDEIKETMNELYRQSRAVLSRKGAITMAERRDMVSLIEKANRDLFQNLPFVSKSFSEQMEKTTLEAKGEIEAFFTNKIYQYGTKELALQLEENGVESILQLRDTGGGENNGES